MDVSKFSEVRNLGKYEADSIRVLKDIEHVRTRPQMYISSENPSYQMFDEIFSNALDELLNGYADKIEVSVNYEEGIIHVEDNGRGLPQGLNKELNKPTVEVIYSKLNSGGKYDQEAYAISGGLHGVGSVVVNALSDYFEVTTWRDNSFVSISFDRGIKRDYQEYKKRGHKGSGTLVCYKIDREHKLFVEDSLKTYEKDIEKRVLLVKTLLPNSTIVYNGTEVGAVTFDKFLHLSKMPLLEDSILINSTNLVLSLNWSEDTNKSTSTTYCNFIYNSNGGDHEKGVGDALAEYFGGNWDVLLGLNLAISVMYPGVEYDSQAKLKAVSKDLRKFVKETVLEELKKYFRLNPAVKEKIQELIKKKRYEINKRNNKGAVRRDRKSTFLNTLGVASFSDCSTKNREEAELYICEGDSAAGSLRQARDIKTQAVLPLRGKVINAYTANVAALLKNAEVATIVSSIDVGIFNDVNVRNSRYGKIIICTDADPDGQNISCQLISLFLHIMPEMVDQGYIYLALPPLYGAMIGKEFKPIYTEEEKNEYLAKGIYVQRYKGLGEMNPSQLYNACMNAKTRSLIQIKTTADCEKIISRIMGGDSSYRKEILKEAGVLDE